MTVASRQPQFDTAVHTRVSREFRALLHARAREERTTVSELLRAAAEQLVSR